MESSIWTGSLIRSIRILICRYSQISIRDGLVFMKTERSEKMREAIRHAAAEFLATESNRTSLITVTGIQLSPKGDRATVLITVFPNEKEKEAIAFAARQGGALRDFIGKRISLQYIPRISFAIDIGEKNRQKMDQLLAS